MTAVRKHAHIVRLPLKDRRTKRIDDVDHEPLSDTERAALASDDGPYVRWEDLKAELRL
jgi:hypothetical protein